MFRYIDVDNSGDINEDELTAFLNSQMKDAQNAEDLPADMGEMVFKRLNSGGTDAIEYSEFLTAAMDQNFKFSKEKITMAF